MRPVYFVNMGQRLEKIQRRAHIFDFYFRAFDPSRFPATLSAVAWIKDQRHETIPHRTCGEFHG
jgi:hypothetical protein